MFLQIIFTTNNRTFLNHLANPRNHSSSFIPVHRPHWSPFITFLSSTRAVKTHRFDAFFPSVLKRVWTIATPCWAVFQLPCWYRSSESCTQRHAPFWISSRVIAWLLFESCTGCQSMYKLCLLVHKSLLGHTPGYISDLLTSVASIPGRSTLRASSCGNLVVPRTRRRIGDKAFSVAAPRAWNRLSTELKLLRSTDSFRYDVRAFLFDSAYRHGLTLWCTHFELSRVGNFFILRT